MSAPSCRSKAVIRSASVFKGELRTLLLNSGDPQSSLAHFLNSDLQGSPKFTRASGRGHSVNDRSVVKIEAQRCSVIALFEIVDHDQIQSIHTFQITKNEQCLSGSADYRDLGTQQQRAHLCSDGYGTPIEQPQPLPRTPSISTVLEDTYAVIRQEIWREIGEMRILWKQVNTDFCDQARVFLIKQWFLARAI